MGRRLHRNQVAHYRLNSWSSWLCQFQDSNALGARIGQYSPDRSGLPAGPIIPDVMRDPQLVETERAVEDQTPVVKRSIFAYYVYACDDPRFFKLTRRQREYMLSSFAKTLGYS